MAGEKEIFNLMRKAIKIYEIPTTKQKVTHCPDCGNKIVDEFPEEDFVGCQGCPRIFNRIKEGRDKK